MSALVKGANRRPRLWQLLYSKHYQIRCDLYSLPISTHSDEAVRKIELPVAMIIRRQLEGRQR